MTVKIAKKLIEVALPLEAINDEGSSRKRKAPAGYPTTLHKWWAQRPVAAARATVFAQMVDDPSEYVDILLSLPDAKRVAERELKARLGLWEKRRAEFAAATGDEVIAVPEPGPRPTLGNCAADIERQRLFRIVEDLVKWENTNNQHALEKAREEIWQSWRRTCAANAGHPRAKELFDRNKLPAFYDPFAGSGAIPLEAQRLGLDAYASDLNPVAVLINKATIEIPPKFYGRSPVNGKRDPHKSWSGAHGLAEDVRYYGSWMEAEARSLIGHWYPKVQVTAEIVADRPDLAPLTGKELAGVAWLWARTVKSPNPAYNEAEVPLVSSFVLSSKASKQVYVEPVVEGTNYRFVVRTGAPPDGAAAGTKLSNSAFKCLLSGVPIPYQYIDAEANDGRMRARLMAIVVEGPRGRLYLSPTAEQEALALSAVPDWRPDLATRGTWASNAQGRRYGFKTFGDYFTDRQLLALSTLSGLIEQARARVLSDALTSGMSDDPRSLEDGGTGAQAYADAIALYLSFGVSRSADYGSSLATWRPKDNAMRSTMPKQAIQMSWDYAEGSPFGKSSPDYSSAPVGRVWRT